MLLNVNTIYNIASCSVCSIPFNHIVAILCYSAHLVSRPVIIRQPTDKVVRVYSSITLECEVRGYGNINVKWRKLGSPLPKTAVVSNNKLKNGVSSTLKITDVVGYYDGTYCCIANNIAGETTSKYANLSVKGMLMHLYLYLIHCYIM